MWWWMIGVAVICWGSLDLVRQSQADMEGWYNSEHKFMVENILHSRLNINEHINEAPIKAYMEGLVLRHPSRILDYLVGLLANNVRISRDWYGRYLPDHTYPMPAASMIKAWSWRSYIPSEMITAPAYPLYPSRGGIIRADPCMSPAGHFLSRPALTTDASIDESQTYAAGSVIILEEGAIDVGGAIDLTKTLVRCGKIPILQPHAYHPLKQQQKLAQLLAQQQQAHHQPPQPLSPHLQAQPLMAQPIFRPTINSTHPLDRMTVLSELEALRMGLHFLTTYYPQIDNPYIFVDCLDLKRGLEGVYSIPEGISYHTFMEVIELLRRFVDSRVLHIYREQNMIADRVAYIARMNPSRFTECWDDDWKHNETVVMKDIESILDLNPLFREMTRFNDALF